MNIDRATTVCFTGHRFYGGNPRDELRLAEALERCYSDGYRTFISGMAPGFDLAAAEAVVVLRARHGDVRLAAAIPFPNQAARFSAADRQRYTRLLSTSDQSTVIAERYRYGCYFERNDWMVRRSSRLVCWYDGSGGGTRYTVRSALGEGIEVVNIFRRRDSLF